MDENKPLTNKELRELLGYVYEDLPTDDEELIKEARDTYLKFKRIHKNCISKQKVEKSIDKKYAKFKEYFQVKQALRELKKELK